MTHSKAWREEIRTLIAKNVADEIWNTGIWSDQDQLKESAASKVEEKDLDYVMTMWQQEDLPAIIEWCAELTAKIMVKCFDELQ